MEEASSNRNSSSGLGKNIDEAEKWGKRLKFVVVIAISVIAGAFAAGVAYATIYKDLLQKIESVGKFDEKLLSMSKWEVFASETISGKVGKTFI